MTPAVRAEGIGKRYALGRAAPRARTLREALAGQAAAAARAAGRLARREPRPAREEFWALRDVSFELAPGEALGLIGGNGAGKSTLLKILSRVTAPTRGRAEIRGRVGSLLEVGTGFHSELSGRENVLLSAAILGMRRREVARKFDEIVAFAEVERFVDTPVKHYSSGMYLRLAFAVAAHLEPEVLLVDEVLAVGDAAFQRKCLGKMEDVSTGGRAVVFVSHNLTAVQSLCSRALRLERGAVVDDGPVQRVVGAYLRGPHGAARERVWDDPAAAPGGGGVRLHRVRVRPEGGAPGDPVTVSTPFAIEVQYWTEHAAAPVVVGLELFAEDETLIFDICPPPAPPAPPGPPAPPPAGAAALVRTACRIPGNLLNDGTYRLVVNLSRGGAPLVPDGVSLVFDLLDSDEQRAGWHGRWPGVLRPLFRWETVADAEPQAAGGAR